MAEYIEQEEIIKVLSNEACHCLTFQKDGEARGLIKAREIIRKLPSADVVKVERCENCKHLTIHNSPTLYAYCEKTHYNFEPFKTDTRTHFCAFGELKECEEKCVNIKE